MMSYFARGDLFAIVNNLVLVLSLLLPITRSGLILYGLKFQVSDNRVYIRASA